MAVRQQIKWAHAYRLTHKTRRDTTCVLEHALSGGNSATGSSCLPRVAFVDVKPRAAEHGKERLAGRPGRSAITSAANQQKSFAPASSKHTRLTTAELQKASYGPSCKLAKTAAVFLRSSMNAQFVPQPAQDRKSTRLNSSHSGESRMPSSA